MEDIAIKSVGVIGLGKIGDPVSRHLLRAGYEVSGYDVSPAAFAAGERHGVAMLASPRDVAARSELVIVLTAFESEAEAVIFGPNGIADCGRSGLIVGIGATIAPTKMREFARSLQQRGMVALDMPICRGEPAAEAGTLLVIGGGEPAAFDRARPVLSTFADTICYLGEAGAGQVGKMVNNLILWACISANHEGLALGETLGVDREAMREMLLSSSGQNWALQTRIADLAMPWAEKDMMIVLKEADDMRMSVPVCAVVKEVIKGIKVARGDW